MSAVRIDALAGVGRPAQIPPPVPPRPDLKRPVPEIHRIRKPPQVGDRRQRQHTRDAALPGRDRCDHRRGPERDHDRAPVGVGTGCAARASKHGEAPDQRRPSRRQQSPVRMRHEAAHDGRRHQGSEQRTRERLEDPAVGPQIRPVLPAAPPQQAEPDGRRREPDRSDHPDRGNTPAGLADEEGDRHEQERPDEVELLLDRERPHVLERARDTVAREVRARRDEVPVRDVEQRRRDVAPQPVTDHCGGDERTPRDHDPDQHQQGRQQPAQPARPEVEHVEPPVAHPAEKQRGDQEPAEHEEDVDTKKARLRARQPKVERHHRRHREQAQAVERVVAPGRFRDARPRLADTSSRGTRPHADQPIPGSGKRRIREAATPLARKYCRPLGCSLERSGYRSVVR